MRRIFLTAPLALAVPAAASAAGYHLSRFQTPPPANAPYGYTPRGPLPPQSHPRIAALAMPGGVFTPGYYAPPVGTGVARRNAPRAIAGTLTTLSYLTAVSLYPIGTGGPIAIRGTHVLANGTPVPGLKRDTLVWVASPWAMKVVDNVRSRRGGPVIGGR